MINISSNYNSKAEYIHGDTLILFDRIYCGVSGTTAVILGVERWRDTTNYYLLADVSCKTFSKLIQTLVSITRIKIDEYFWKPTKTMEDILTRHHIQAFRAREKQLFFNNIPSDSLVISAEIEAIMSQLNPKHLYLFQDSRVPAALQALPTDYSKLRAEDHPLVAALGYALTMMLDINSELDSGDMSLSARKYG